MVVIAMITALHGAIIVSIIYYIIKKAENEYKNKKRQKIR